MKWDQAPAASRIFSLQRRVVRVLTNLEFRKYVKQKFIDQETLTLTCLQLLMSQS